MAVQYTQRWVLRMSLHICMIDTTLLSSIIYIRTISKPPVSVDYIYRMVGLLSTLPVGKDMEQLLNYYFNIMLMSASVRR